MMDFYFRNVWIAFRRMKERSMFFFEFLFLKIQSSYKNKTETRALSKEEILGYGRLCYKIESDNIKKENAHLDYVQ